MMAFEMVHNATYDDYYFNQPSILFNSVAGSQTLSLRLEKCGYSDDDKSYSEEVMEIETLDDLERAVEIMKSERNEPDWAIDRAEGVHAC